MNLNRRGFLGLLLGGAVVAIMPPPLRGIAEAETLVLHQATNPLFAGEIGRYYGVIVYEDHVYERKES